MEKVGSAANAAAGSHAEAGVARSAEKTSAAPKTLKLVMVSSCLLACTMRVLSIDMNDS